MKVSQKSSALAKEPGAVQVLLAYDDPRTCAAMLKMLDRISTRLRDKKLFNVNAIKFGLLVHMDPIKWTAAGAEAVQLAMVSFGEKGVPGAGLLRWLDDWAKGRAGQNAGLGLLPLGPQTGPQVRRVVRALKEIAARHNLGFIYEPASAFKLG